MIDINEFDAIKIGLASTKQIHDWSSGEVTKPETINYRTLKPEKDGLFCERIFGPTKDWECYCGKYKRVRYKGIICERCGVEVTRQKVRRERMGHIDLAAPVSHIWFFKGVPSRIGYLLDIAPKELEKVLYFAASMIIWVDDEKRLAELPELAEKVAAEEEHLGIEREELLAAVEERLARRREYFVSGAEDGFDEDDEYWARLLHQWAEEQAITALPESRELANGLLKEVARRVAGEDTKRVRETVRQAAVREDRDLGPKDLDLVAAVAGAVLAAIADDVTTIHEGKGTAKGNARKKLDRVASFLAGDAEALNPKDGDLVAAAAEHGVSVKDVEKARGLAVGLLSDVVRAQAETAPEERGELRDLTNDLCLKTDGRMSKDDVRVIEQWALKVREAYLDAQSRRKDAEESIEERVRLLHDAFEKFKEIRSKDVVADERLFRELKDRFGSEWGFGVFFDGGMGANAVRELLRREDLDALELELRDTIRTSKGQKQQRAIKRLKVVSAFRESDNRPEWMILDAVPVIPPELRPMVQLDGGRFATSDLNDLYRRVINRNNRLKRLLDLGAPEIIVNNEKRMLQEAVDALFDNGRRGRAVTGPGNRPLKSLSDMLKGKQGRFRQNLLGKRVDYSGRSVIVSGPRLKLHQCGLPKLMALELFKPFIMSRLVDRKVVQNIKAAKKMVDSMDPIVWDVLDEVIPEHPVLLNRAPTLHRLGIQAFEPVLIDGKAIQVHPLVCHAFNADFDGDQMAVHLPLSVEAQAEARILMLSSNNILSPAHGRPLATPTQDMVIGLYYLTDCEEDVDAITVGPDRPLRAFRDVDEIQIALDSNEVKLQEPITFRRGDQRLVTTPGRVIFNSAIEGALHEQLSEAIDGKKYEWENRTLAKREIGDVISGLVDVYGPGQVAPVLDAVKDLGFTYATRAGVTVSKNDIVTPPRKGEILAGFELQVEKIHDLWQQGLITEGERKEKVVEIWGRATEDVADEMMKQMRKTNPIFMMATSGARGSFKQIRQLAGMRGLMANPKGEIIERPVKANFMEGLSVLEYFVSTHGARKGLADTALRTADSGYLTRRLVDVSQDMIVREEDCGTEHWIETEILRINRPNRSLVGRVLAERLELADGTVLDVGEYITGENFRQLVAQWTDHPNPPLVRVRSVLGCQSDVGVCRRCYGYSLATGAPSEIGDAVGIIAAQSIGEPGTQLTMRTFHEGGVAGSDITHGLPRVVELFEARNPKGAAILSEVTGRVERVDGERSTTIVVWPDASADDPEPEKREYPIPRRTRLMVTEGEIVGAGDPLTEGSLNPTELLELSDNDPGRTEVYIVGEVLKVYESQGVEINDKHIELIVRQMLKKVRVEDAGDTRFLPGQLVDKPRLVRENRRVTAAGGQPAETVQVILGITKASLATESFLSAASFQETTKVLTDAAIEGKIDRLTGLKENVIIGKLIPASTGLKRYRQLQIAAGEGSALFHERLLADVAAQITVDGDGEPLMLGTDGEFPFVEPERVEEQPAD